MPSQTRARKKKRARAGAVPQQAASAKVARLNASRYAPFKVVVEWVLALFLLVLAMPVLVVAALLVKLTSPGPAIYSQTRLGKNGRLYRVHKIRTMYHNCEKLSGPQWSYPGDPRVTTLGRFLRRTHIDELPQLWNVLRGEMSLVGPRPERPEIAKTLEGPVPGYRHRLLVRPGVTGLAQVSVPADTDIESVKRKLAYDLYYVQNLSLRLDVQIIVSTAFKVLGMSFRTLRTLFRLPRREVVEPAAKPAPVNPGVRFQTGVA
jgi:lipopolysaccharide/colanic/teichoic acid biosynthesis glycosyltransferase